MNSLVLWFYLLFNSFYDSRFHEVEAFSTITLLLEAVVGWLLYPERYIHAGIIPAAVLACFSILSGEKLGMGDVLVIALIGLRYGFWNTLVILFWSFSGILVYGLVFLRNRKNKEIPFLPFLMGGLAAWSIGLYGI